MRQSALRALFIFLIILLQFIVPSNHVVELAPIVERQVLLPKDALHLGKYITNDFPIILAFLESSNGLRLRFEPGLQHVQALITFAI